MLKYVKAFTRNELDLALVDFNTFVIILTSNRIKITNLKKDNSKLIYKQILNINKVKDNYTLLREVIIKNEA